MIIQNISIMLGRTCKKLMVRSKTTSLVLWKLRMSGIFCDSRDSHRSEINFSLFSSLAHISIHMVHFTLVQLPVYSFPNWNGNTDISVAIALPSYSYSVLRCFFLSFLFRTNTMDYRIWKKYFQNYLAWP